MNLKLYLFISAYNVDNWIIFVRKPILKSPIIIVKQCQSIVCIMFSKIELKCDTSNLGGLYIAIIYIF
jgi:hypothetical protein